MSDVQDILTKIFPNCEPRKEPASFSPHLHWRIHDQPGSSRDLRQTTLLSLFYTNHPSETSQFAGHALGLPARSCSTWATCKRKAATCRSPVHLTGRNPGIKKDQTISGTLQNIGWTELNKHLQTKIWCFFFFFFFFFGVHHGSPSHKFDGPSAFSPWVMAGSVLPSPVSPLGLPALAAASSHPALPFGNSMVNLFNKLPEHNGATPKNIQQLHALSCPRLALWSSPTHVANGTGTCPFKLDPTL